MDTLRPWQTETVHELFHCAHNIIWVIDPIGGAGKTWLADYLVENHGAQKFWHIAPGIVRSFKVSDPGMLVFDLDYDGHIDNPSLMKMACSDAFTADCVCCRPKVLCLATFGPPEGIDETECHIMPIKN